MLQTIENWIIAFFSEKYGIPRERFLWTSNVRSAFSLQANSAWASLARELNRKQWLIDLNIAIDPRNTAWLKKSTIGDISNYINDLHEVHSRFVASIKVDENFARILADENPEKSKKPSARKTAKKLSSKVRINRGKAKHA